MVLEGAAADGFATTDQQEKIAVRRRKGFGRIAVEFGRSTFGIEIVAVAAVIFVNQFIDQRLGMRVERAGIEKRIAHIVHHPLSSVRKVSASRTQ
ncbi:hypothetical protein [Rhizobium leguminosarum]|uniref:hypothetical protein n=1 Tax=Rhizobium leguminosarum TaxID=384 RepID=UPI003F973DC4